MHDEQDMLDMARFCTIFFNELVFCRFSTAEHNHNFVITDVVIMILYSAVCVFFFYNLKCNINVLIMMRLLPISRLCEFYTSIANRFKTSLFASVMQLVKGHCVSFF